MNFENSNQPRVNREGAGWNEIEEKDKRIEELEAEIERLKQEARYDTATGILNKNGFEKEVESRFVEQLNQHEGHDQRERQPEPLNVVFADLNGFKPINDEYGHEAGDRMLTAVAQNLESELRASDVVARIGGDEFLVAFTGDKKARESVRYKVKHAIENAEIDAAGEQLSVGASVGAATHEPGEDITETIQRADEEMYSEKKER